MENEQVRLGDDLLRALRTAVAGARASGSVAVRPVDLLLGLIEDERVGRSVKRLTAPNTVERARADLPGAHDGEGEREETLTFLSPDGAQSLALDPVAFRLVLDGVRRAAEVVRPVHLVYAFAGEAVKNHAVLTLFSVDPETIVKAIDALPG